jgi:hypothetical protein
VPIACNRATADFMLSSPLMREDYHRFLPLSEKPSRRGEEVTAEPPLTTLLTPSSTSRVTN